MRAGPLEVKVGGMKPSLSLTSPRTKTSPSQRCQLVAAFERSGLSAAAFARQHGIAYTTLCSWRRRRRPAMPEVGFAEVELVRPPSPEPIVVEWGSRARMRLSSHAQLELAVSLVKGLEAAC